jgi:DNA-binding CsgD family transcriptional regulator
MTFEPLLASRQAHGYRARSDAETYHSEKFASPSSLEDAFFPQCHSVAGIGMMETGATLLSILEHVRCGAVLLDDGGRVIYMNACAERCLVPVAGREPTAPRKGEWATKAIAGLLGRTLCRRPAGAPVLVAHPNGSGRPLVIHTLRLENLPSPERAHTLAIFIDTGDMPTPAPRTLREIFNLTAAEARLASRLAAGESLREIAADANISIGTARAQLKAVLSKTRTHRQGELVALLLRLAMIR